MRYLLSLLRACIKYFQDALKRELCFECGKRCKEPIWSSPSRHACSPNKFNFKYPFCSTECSNRNQKVNYAHWAELDRNASDSECFEHHGWEGKYRIGRCKITGDAVRVEPVQPGNNSGQPKACYEHFTLLKKYQDLIAD